MRLAGALRLLPILAFACGACDATLHGVATDAPLAPTSAHLGGLLEGKLHLPKTYALSLGAETAHLGQIHPGTAADQWRAGLVAGYGRLLRATDPPLTPEATAHLGVFRGSDGASIVTAGPYAGLTVGLPYRISGHADPWDLDQFVLSTVALVPQIGASALVPDGRFADTQLELFASLGLRLTLSSTLLP
jgi:hypothetical protein